jgi:hypothetical protein
MLRLCCITAATAGRSAAATSQTDLGMAKGSPPIGVSDLSTIIKVYPRNTSAPAFRELLDLGAVRLHEQLAARGIDARPQIDVHLIDCVTDELLPLDLTSPAIWSPSEYAWFFVPGTGGGTDVSYDSLCSEELKIWAELIDEHAPAGARQDEINACQSNGVCWSFRRSAGQPALINFTYGILAATLAELTNGFIFSDDGAWDYTRFPATPQEFFECYFRPERAIDPCFASWSRTCLDAIAAGDA